jgi:hypothetical protein
MDLGTVETKLDENAYADARALLADARLVFDNAMLYNPPDHAVHKNAAVMRAFFEDSWREELSKTRAADDARAREAGGGRGGRGRGRPRGRGRGRGRGGAGAGESE